MNMGKNFIRITVLAILCGLIIGIPSLLNIWLPLNFSFYFFICAASIFLCFALQYGRNKKKTYKRATLIIPWLITTIASFLVTLNYLSPRDSRVYSNADANVLALKGFDIKDSILLIGDDKTNSFYDDPTFEGRMSILPSDSSCLLVASIYDQPLYMSSPKFEHDTLLNGSSLPQFSHTVSFGDSLKCTIVFSEVNERHLLSRIDSMAVTISFENGPHINKYSSAFNQRIKNSYNLYDVIHKNVSFNSEEEELVEHLRDVTLIRNREYKGAPNDNKFYITFPHSLEAMGLICDGVTYEDKKEKVIAKLSSSDCIYIGQYSTNTRPISFNNRGDGYIELRFKFPYLYNFPRSASEENFVDGQRKILAISSSSERLLQSDVEEAFYCDLFHLPENSFGFSGTLNYKVSTSDVPFNPNFIDDRQRADLEPNTLMAKNGAIWHVKICDLRKTSPVTDKPVIFVSSFFIILIISICCLFAFLSTQLYYRDAYKAGVVFTIWLFVIPIFVFRLFLLWRIAVFPPVADITYNVFQRYRMENAWSDNAMVNTIIALLGFMLFTILSIIFENKILFATRFGNRFVLKKVTANMFIYSLCWGVTVLASVISSGVFANIFAPVICFILCEYISLKGLNYKWRIANVLLSSALLCKGDPGYAIMFIIFACVYYIIHLYAYLKSSSSITTNKALAFMVWVLLFVLLGASIIFSPQLVGYAYDDTTRIFNSFVTPSRLFFTTIAILGSLILFIYFWIKSKKKWAICSLLLIPLMSVSFYILGRGVLEHERHFKYRSLVHTEQVSEIMEHEDIGDRNSTRVLEASQNQWFIQYHNNRGTSRVLEDGIFSLSPHFKKGVTWNTQISDVIISRYVVGEISSILPAIIVLLSLSLIVFLFYANYSSVASRSVAYAVGLLLLIQMTFVWMAATNRMIFFGQDFPFLSQNARITMFMFVVLLGLVMLVTSSQNQDYETASNIERGMIIFAKNRIHVFISIFVLIFIFVGLFGNKYASLYGENDGGNGNDASEYNLTRMMNRCQSDLSLINAYLSTSNIKVRTKLVDGESLASLMDSLDNERGEGSLTQSVKELYDKKEISKFTLSMYNAYRNNLKRSNSISNIIHLKLNSTRTHYEFALNNGFYSLKNPDLDANAWTDNIYSENVRTSSNGAFKIEKNGYTIYGIPPSWVPEGSQVGIVDATNVNTKTITHRSTLHTESSDYVADLPIYCISAGDILEVVSKDGRYSESYRYGLPQEDILVKNMVINGKRKFFYPLKEKCYWLKDFSDLASYCYSKEQDSIVITLDKNLTSNVYTSLENTRKVCSVIAMDGHGNVRVMADYKGRNYMLNPNEEDKIYERVKYSYLNPNPKEDLNFFGNMNLCLLSPGPGSSLKPITYAAVTSQSIDFPWEKLELMNPSPEYYQSNDSILKKQDSKGVWRTYLYKYGPSYKYKKPFQSIYSDEDGAFGYAEQRWVNNIFYLAQSSNYYNALVTYIGHYGSLNGSTDINNHFRLANTTDYPKFTFDGGRSVYTFRTTPKEENSANNLLLEGLASNFSMPTYIAEADTLRLSFTGLNFSNAKGMSKDKIAGVFPWVFPQSSRILDYLLEELTPAERLRQYTLGSYPLAITPLKMAEMYGKLYSLHPDFHATIIPNRIPFRENWRGRDGDLESQEDMFKFYQRNLYNGMAECVKQGTAKEIITNLPDTYYYYAKTGTLLGSGASLDDRMLAVVISNKKIEDASFSDDLRFYIVYFRFKQSGNMVNVSEVLNHIINSKSFSNYMK